MPVHINILHQEIINNRSEEKTKKSEEEQQDIQRLLQHRQRR